MTVQSGRKAGLFFQRTQVSVAPQCYHDEMRAEYKRADFAALERGKFYKEVAKGTSVALIEPNLAKAFPTSEAVNEALRSFLALADEAARITSRSKRRPARKRASA